MDQGLALLRVCLFDKTAGEFKDRMIPFKEFPHPFDLFMIGILLGDLFSEAG
jgi:hypothetical protein